MATANRRENPYAALVPENIDLPPDSIFRICLLKKGTNVGRNKINSTFLYEERLRLEQGQAGIDQMRKELRELWDRAKAESLLVPYSAVQNQYLKEHGVESFEQIQDWWRRRYEVELQKYREELARTVVTRQQSEIRAKQVDEFTPEQWKNPDLPDDYAWTASRRCLLPERQAVRDPQGNLLPLTDEDFAGCPSPAARLYLSWAYFNLDKFMKELMQLQMSTWKANANAAVAIETAKIKAAAAAAMREEQRLAAEQAKAAKAESAVVAEEEPPPLAPDESLEFIREQMSRYTKTATA